VRHLAILLAAALFALPALAQHGGPPGAMPPGGQMPPEMMAMMQKQARIMAAQKKAFEDPAIMKKRDELQAFIEARIVKNDPSQKANLAKMHKLEADLKVAAASKDQAKGQKIMAEAGELMKKLDPAMKAAMTSPDVEKKLKEFEAVVEKKMASIDPEVPKLIAEMEAVMKKMGGPQHGGPPPMR
jgi:hypothetical protein